MAFLMALYVVGWVYYIQKEARRFWYHRPRWAYCVEPTNVFELLSLVLMGVFIGYIVKFLADGGKLGLDVNEASYRDMYELAWTFTDGFAWAGIVGLLSALKIFRYLGINKRMNTLW